MKEMSTPTLGNSAGNGNKPRGFSRFVRRVSKIFKRDRGQKQSIPTTPTPVPAKEAAVPARYARQYVVFAPQWQCLLTYNSMNVAESRGTQSNLAPTAVAATGGTSQPSQNAMPAPTAPTPATTLTAKDYSKIQEEKARALFVKYNMVLEPGEWTPPFRGDVVRVEKKIRMRVHRTCHRCQTTFGVDRVCNNCNHRRCKKCPRYPSSKPKGGKGKGATAGAIVADDNKDENSEQASAQRVRKKCHKCQAPFPTDAVMCLTCKHIQCPHCPRDL